MSVIITGALAVASLAPPSADAAGPRALSEKEVITSIDQLPRHTYAVSGSVVELLESDEALLDLGASAARSSVWTVENGGPPKNQHEN